jgi:hypothetical protein
MRIVHGSFALALLLSGCYASTGVNPHDPRPAGQPTSGLAAGRSQTPGAGEGWASGRASSGTRPAAKDDVSFASFRHPDRPARDR